MIFVVPVLCLAVARPAGLIEGDGGRAEAQVTRLLMSAVELPAKVPCRDELLSFPVDVWAMVDDLCRSHGDRGQCGDGQREVLGGDGDPSSPTPLAA